MLGVGLDLWTRSIPGLWTENPYSGYALALDFDDPDYWVSGTNYAALSSVPGYSFTRTGEQGAIDSDGTVDWFAANVPAINGNGYHAYGALTNLVANSQDATAWIGSGALAAANSLTAPDGTTTADTLTSVGVAAVQTRYSTFAIASGSTYSNALFFKAGTERYAEFRFGSNVSAAWIACVVDLQTGTITQEASGASGTLVDVVVTALADGWYCVALTGSLLDTTGYLYAGMSSVAVPSRGGFGEIADAGTDGRTLYVWQKQNLLGNFPDGGPLIRTAGTTASIGASALAVTQSLADEDGLFWAICDFPGDSPGNDWMVSWNAGSDANRIDFFRQAGNLGCQISVSSVVSLNETVASPGAMRVIGAARRRGGKWTFAYKLGSNAAVVSTEGAASAFPTTVTKLEVGSYAGAQHQADAPVEGVFHRRGTFSDADVRDILDTA